MNIGIPDFLETEYVNISAFSNLQTKGVTRPLLPCHSMGLVDLHSISVCLTCSVRMLTLLSNSGKAGSSAALKVANVVSYLDINLYRYP